MSDDERILIGRLVEGVETLQEEVRLLRVDVGGLKEDRAANKRASRIYTGLIAGGGGVAGSIATWAAQHLFKP